jgi:hypothetical protein
LAILLGPLAVAALIAYILASHGHDFGHSASRAGLLTLAAVTVLSLASLVARTEAVVACLSAMGNRPPRREIHSTNGLTYVAMSINHYIASPVRAALLKRIDRERAPSIPQMVMVDASTTLIEALLVAIVIIASASTLKLPWWGAVALALAAVGGFAAALALRSRFRNHAALRGLDVLAHSRLRFAVAALEVLVISCQIARTWIVLDAVGLHPTLLQASATFVTAGVLSSLLAGPSAGAAGAPLIIFGHQSLGAAGAAGLILSVTGIVASVVYAALAAPVYFWRLRRAGS